MSDQDPADPAANPFPRVTDHWEAVVEDMHTTAGEYREDDWTVVDLHPGDVTVLTGEPRTAAEQTGDFEPEPRRVGFDVVVPGDEFERLQSALDGRSVAGCEVFRAEDSGIVYLVVAIQTVDEEVAALVPMYYDRTDLDDLVRIADEHGLYTHVRPLSNDQVVTIKHNDAAPFFPESRESDDAE